MQFNKLDKFGVLILFINKFIILLLSIPFSSISFIFLIKFKIPNNDFNSKTILYSYNNIFPKRFSLFFISDPNKLSINEFNFFIKLFISSVKRKDISKCSSKNSEYFSKLFKFEEYSSKLSKEILVNSFNDILSRIKLFLNV